jgi:hypothetical protein
MTEVSQSISQCLQGNGRDSRTDIVTGKMLRLIHGQLRDNGHVFLVLPRPCIENSRYLDNELLTRIMRHVGFKEVVRKDKEGAKVVYSLWQKQKPIRDSQQLLRFAQVRKSHCHLMSGSMQRNVYKCVTCPFREESL